MASRGRPYRTVQIGAFEVLIGRGSEENDALTFRVAERNDTWLHVGGGTPGSHVVIRNPDRVEIPREVLETAAAAAAWHSKARSAKAVTVDYCLAASVSKPRGAPAGSVELSKWKTLRVAPKAPPSGEEE
ncbi:hypothetical protein BH09MYX1_BH09MYX1_24150 [soil metagenome]